MNCISPFAHPPLWRVGTYPLLRITDCTSSLAARRHHYNKLYGRTTADLEMVEFCELEHIADSISGVVICFLNTDDNL